MKDFKEFAEIYVGILTLPIIILVFKLCVYMWETEFQDWWVTILWVLMLPITFILVMALSRLKGESK